MDGLQWLREGDAVTRGVALLLLAMSVASWVVIVWRLRLLLRAGAGVRRAKAAFWQAASLDAALPGMAAFDREGLALPLVRAARQDPGTQGTLAGAGDAAQRLTRVLREALDTVARRLQFGQVLLATVGSIAPFVGLLGTVWGIYHALVGLSQGGQITIERVAGPVGEALVMTAAGLAVAIPAVLAYNVFGRIAGRIEADLEGFAHDLRELLAGGGPPRG
ncbi:MotA/TolQ/ExbB proton channel family protein [Ramlibacter sp. H39-3-26]|uniref:MotA/TolQ/ExbB proton channel family protein n=1 Tax=Curvibacter soli TaxID=3031331 RepID=UPI0023DAE541|nr:MotA/TolQ/ExbB proton channel family protein [Ramlibacter sp. H39-3-26]MDF1486039.1 MotA/TolQ/ExbB proton channel family protein [Ramlibacter sp. H39-3-26]